MAVEVLLKKTGKWLTPIDPHGMDALAGIGSGEVLRVKWVRPRNVRHHRKFFALLRVVFEAQDRFATQQDLLDALKIALGRYREVKIGNRTVIHPKSISFSSMDQDAFNEFYDAAVKVVIEVLIPGIDREGLEEQVFEILGESL